MIVNAAFELHQQVGWSDLTMARLAKQVGVSRQTLYNEIEGKANLAEILRARSRDQLADVIDEAFAAVEVSSGDLRGPVADAIGRAARNLRAMVQIDPMLRAMLAMDRVPGSNRVPTQPEALDLLDQVRRRFAMHLEQMALGLTDRQLAHLVDVVVRLIWSEAGQQRGAQAAAPIAWVARRLLILDDEGRPPS
ncbi:MAG: helix-turn-helix domain-containing protein [Nocardioides sp.]